MENHSGAFTIRYLPYMTHATGEDPGEQRGRDSLTIRMMKYMRSIGQNTGTSKSVNKVMPNAMTTPFCEDSQNWNSGRRRLNGLAKQKNGYRARSEIHQHQHQHQQEQNKIENANSHSGRDTNRLGGISMAFPLPKHPG